MKVFEIEKEQQVNEDYYKVKILDNFSIIFDSDEISFKKDKVYAVRKDVLRHIDYLGLLKNVSFNLKESVKETKNVKEEKK